MKKIIATAALSIISMTIFAQEDDNRTPTDKYSVSTNMFTSNWFVTLQGTYSNFMDGGAGNHLMDSPMWGGSIAIGKWFTPGLGLRAKMNGWTTKNSHFATSDHHNSYWTLTGDVMFSQTCLRAITKNVCGTSFPTWQQEPHATAPSATTCLCSEQE